MKYTLLFFLCVKLCAQTKAPDTPINIFNNANSTPDIISISALTEPTCDELWAKYDPKTTSCITHIILALPERVTCKVENNVPILQNMGTDITCSWAAVSPESVQLTELIPYLYQ